MLSLRRSLAVSALAAATLLPCSFARAAEAPANALADAEAAREQELIATDVQRVAALVAGDHEALEHLLATELTYGHADGRQESKADLLMGIRSGRQRYHAVNVGERRVRFLTEDNALISGTADLLVGPADAPFKLRVRYLAVYQRKLRLGWQLVAYQSTRLPE